MRVAKLWCCQTHFLCTLLFTQVSVYRRYFAGGTGDIDSDAFFRQSGLFLQAASGYPCALLVLRLAFWLFAAPYAGRTGCFFDARFPLQHRVDRFVAACGPFTVSIICFCGFTFCSGFDIAGLLLQGVSAWLCCLQPLPGLWRSGVGRLRRISVFQLDICAGILLVLAPCIDAATSQNVVSFQPCLAASAGDRFRRSFHHIALRGRSDRLFRKGKWVN